MEILSRRTERTEQHSVRKLGGYRLSTTRDPGKSYHDSTRFGRQGRVDNSWAIAQADSAPPQSSSGWDLVVDIETKNAEDSDADATPLGSLTASTPIESFSDRLELARYRYGFSGNSTDRWIHLRMNPPIWQPN